MKVAILAGGLGTRLAEETEVRPKPMVEIGGHPILCHIMKHYAHFGFNEFVIALGYKGEYIKRWMRDYGSLEGNMRINTRTLLGELSLHGKFQEVSQPLFFHRIHAESSVRQFPVFRERAAWFNPNLQGRLVLSAWRQFFQMLGAVRRAPIGLRARLACYWQSLRWFKWRWRWMFRELFMDLRDFLRRAFAQVVGTKRPGSPHAPR